jgi:hypothetical protein
MMADNQISTVYNLSYDVPRVLLSSPGRQNRASDGQLRITPGMTEPFEFVFGNQDGMAINLVPFTIKMVFWKTNTITEGLAGLGQTEIILAKTAEVGDPYSARAMIVLLDTETVKLGLQGARQLRWGVFMIGTDQTVYPCNVSSSGGRYGTVSLDLTSGTPTAEIIRSL